MKNKERIVVEQLMQQNLSGIVLRKDFIDWAYHVQKYYSIDYEIPISDFKKLAGDNGIKVVNSLMQYEELKKIYGSKCEMPASDIKPRYKKIPNKRKGKVITKEQIIEVYINQGLNQYEAATKLRIGTDRLQKLLKEYGIKREIKKEETEPRISKEKLYDLYINNCYPMLKISLITGISQTTICKYLKYYGIEARPQWQKHAELLKKRCM